jgi:hypothetical protein
MGRSTFCSARSLGLGRGPELGAKTAQKEGLKVNLGVVLFSTKVLPAHGVSTF